VDLNGDLNGDLKVSLDRFLPPTVAKPKQDSAVFIQERCANPKCRKILKVTDPKYTLRIKSKNAVYCSACAKKILHPQEDREENL